MSLFFFGILATLAAGAIVKAVAGTGWVDQWYIADVRKRVTWREFIIGAVICAVVVVPFTAFVGNKIALSNNLTFHEFWNGYETAALRSDTECHKNGSCRYTYQCDPHLVAKTRTVPNADGKGSHTETYYETEYDSCPEATVEWSFRIATTLGDFDAGVTFPDNPVAYRDSHGIRGDVLRGPPPIWTAAQARIAAGDPGPVTVKKDYENYILASQSTILKKHSDDLERYRSILPSPANTAPVHDLYQADKVYLAGTTIDVSVPAWSAAVSRFNAAFGSDLQGDLHLVFVDSTEDPDSFTGALNAYWTSKTFGRDAISKNTLVVVIGVRDHSSEWVRAFTGMPRGNEQLLADIQRELQHEPLDPDLLLGRPVGKIDPSGQSIVHSTGLLEQQMWGVNKFARVCMTCQQEGGGGFTYLGGDIEITGGQRAAIIGAAFLVSLIVWVAFVLIGTTNQGSNNDRTRTDEWDYLRRTVRRKFRR